MNSLEIDLLNKYKEILQKEGYPDWAFELYPAMPFVGNNYIKMDKKILLYGSAENLGYLWDAYIKKDTWISKIGDDGFARNRYKFDNDKNKNDFFPYGAFHMQPILDGSLLTVAKFITEKKTPKINFSDNTYEFIEQIAIGNIAKFSIKSKDNVDYPPKNKKKLLRSYSYIYEEIKLLKPDIIILPVTIYYKFKNQLSEILTQINLRTEIIGIYQVNPQAINNSIKTYLNENELNYTDIELSPVIHEWCSHIKMRNKNGIYNKRYIDKLIKMYLKWLERRL